MPELGNRHGQGNDKPQYEDLLAIFEVFDTDQDGFVSKSEMRRALAEVRRRVEAETLGAESQTDVVLLQTTNVDSLFDADTDGDGHLSFAEFYNAALDVRAQTQGIQAMSTFPWFIRLSGKLFLPTIHPEPITPHYVEEYMAWWPPNTRRPLPLFLVFFSLIQIAAFIHYAREECGADVDVECPLSFSSDLAFRPGCRSEVWRFFTYVLVHAGIVHLVFNLVLQLIVGVPLEMVHGPFRVAVLYVLGTLFASLASSLFDPETNLVGASGAVYALVGAHIANLIINWDNMLFGWLRTFFVLSFVIADTGVAVWNRYYGDSGDEVSYAGHVAGLLVGATLGTSVLRNLESEVWEKWLGRVGIVVSAIFVIVAVIFNILYDYKNDTCESHA